MKVFFILTLFISSHSYAIHCEWWQTEYSATVVDKHPRQGTSGVKEHPRKKYCRDKWKDADHHIKQFKNGPIAGWSNKGEVFKKWKQNEIQTLLEILPKLPVWTEVKNYFFRRAEKSIHKGNPATSELTQKSIVLYDLFFKYTDKLGAIGHETSLTIWSFISLRQTS